MAAVLAEAAPNLLPPTTAWAGAAGTGHSFQKLRKRFGASCRGAVQQGLAELLAHFRRGGTSIGRRPPTTSPSWPPAELAATRFVRRG